MGGIGKVVHDSEGGIPSILEHFRFSTEEVPQRRTTEAGFVNVIQLELCCRMTKMKLLTEIIVLGNILGPFHKNIMLHSIHLILQIIAQMFPRRHPRKIGPTELNVREFSFSLQEGQTFGLAFSGIWICTELEIMTHGIVFTDVDHFLKTIEARSQEKVVIRVAKNSKKVTIYPAP